MTNINNKTNDIFKAAGIAVPEVLLPDATRCDYAKWSVIACDQFTSQPEYWDSVERAVGVAPSTLRLTLPEIYLTDNFDSRIAAIHKAMDDYITGEIFMSPLKGFILTERLLRGGVAGSDTGGGAGYGADDARSRWGLIAAVDLEAYSFEPDAKSLIRSTEGTIRERLPARVKIRRGAALELPHVLVLADDTERSLIEPLATDAEAGKYDKLYDFELMEGGGHIRGYHIGENGIAKVASALEKMLRNAQAASPGAPLLFAVGDGNHSLAAAKSYWDELKTSLPPEAAQASPARYALVEIVNLHSDALSFEPIHRALFNVDPKDVLKKAWIYFGANAITFLTGINTQNNEAGDAGQPPFDYKVMSGGKEPIVLRIGRPDTKLPVAELQRFIDDYCVSHPDTTVDYIHGSDELARLSRNDGCICFELPQVSKNGFFDSVVTDGPMPRKAFSMGEANEKRYYLEARRIAP
jgi:hypothetical protein